MKCKHCGDEVVAMAPGSWKHLRTNLGRCQSATVPYGHLAEPVGVPCRSDGPNPCLGAGLELVTEIRVEGYQDRDPWEIRKFGLAYEACARMVTAQPSGATAPCVLHRDHEGACEALFTIRYRGTT